MGSLQRIVEQNEITDEEGFEKAASEARNVSDGELFKILTFKLSPSTKVVKDMQALAKYELERRSFSAQKKLSFQTTVLSSTLGIIGTVLGVILGYMLGKM